MSIDWPPERLVPMAARFRPLFVILWTALALVAVASTAGGAWRNYVAQLQVAPRFDRVGLLTLEEDGGNGWSIGAIDDALAKRGVVDGSRAVAVDGRPVRKGADEEQVSRLLDGPPGPVAVTLAAPDGRIATYRLTRTAAQAGNGIISDAMFFAITCSGDLAGALAILLVAAMLARQQTTDPVSIIMATAFVALVIGLPVAEPWWEWLGIFGIGPVGLAVAFTLFFIALPAFPDGRYVPRWGAWMTLGAVPVAVLLALPIAQHRSAVAIALGYAAIVAIVPVMRFRRTPPGIERQQLKWVGFGFFVAAVLMILALAMLSLTDVRFLPFALRVWIQLVGWMVLHAGILLMPLGVMIAIRRYRLWDADRVIGRSAGWAVLAFGGSAVWAVSATLLDQIVKTGTGSQDNKAASAGLSTILALAVLGPARAKVVGWMDRRFRSSILGLRALPQHLRLWRHDDTPEQIGARIAQAVSGLLHIERVAVLLYEEGAYRCLATTAAAIDMPPTLDDPLYPLRLTIEDGDMAIGALLLGARIDGSLCGGDERVELNKIVPELAITLRHARRLAVRDRQMDDALTALLQRIERMGARTGEPGA